MRQPGGPCERFISLHCSIASVPYHLQDGLRLEASHRIRGKGLTQLRLPHNPKAIARS
jgi:hypothetical protein